MLDAVCNVIVQHFLFDSAEGCSHGGDLCHDIDAIAIFLDHAGKTTHLALDAVEAFET